MMTAAARSRLRITRLDDVERGIPDGDLGVAEVGHGHSLDH